MEAFSDVGRDQLIWTVTGILLAIVVAFVLYSFVGALVFGLFLYYALRPVYRWLDGYTNHPDLAATVTLLVVGLPTLLILGYAVLVGAQELNQLLGGGQTEQLQAMLEPYVDVASLTQPRQLLDVTGNNLGPLLAYAGALFTWGIRLFVIITIAFYLLRDDRKIADWYRDSFEDVDGAVAFGDGVDDDLTTIYTGNLLTIGITGVIAALVYFAFDWLAAGTVIAYPILLGFLLGIFTVVPAVGMKLIYVPFAGYLFVRSLVWGQLPFWVPVTFLVVTVVIIDTIPDIFIRSLVSSGDINMGLMMLSYVLGSIAFGWYGVFLGPIVLVLALHFAKHILPRLVEGRAPKLTTD